MICDRLLWTGRHAPAQVQHEQRRDEVPRLPRARVVAQDVARRLRVALAFLAGVRVQQPVKKPQSTQQE